MRAGKLVFATCLTVLLASGCASSSVYVTQRVAMDTDPTFAFSAVKAFAAEQGWTLTTVAPRAGYLEALTPVRVLGAVEVRDRWTFRVMTDGIEATKELEAHFGRDEWERSPYVCDSYEYREERATLSDIVSFMNTNRTVLAANTGR